ncbi:MAG: CHAT domain-containing protein [Anaerolineae bacterium]|nr:CHAT domain-containing protein [Anaerolineae bacterium]
MSFFKRLLGGQKEPSQEQIIKAVLAFIKAQTPEESQRIIRTHADKLLTNFADQILMGLLMQARSDPNVVQVLKERRALLARCRKEGIEDVFPNSPPQSGTGVVSQNALAGMIREINQLTHPNDIPRRIELCLRALPLVPRTQNAQLWATLHVILGSCYAQNPIDNRSDNLEKAIVHFQKALEVWGRQTMPVKWGQATMDLATAYKDRIQGDPAENFEQAILLYQQVLTVITAQTMPVEWARTMHNLAGAYANRIRGDRAKNLEQAITHYKQALAVRSRQVMPIEWATTTMDLANAYSERIQGDRAENLDQAISYFKQALTVITRRTMPNDWALATMNMAITFKDRVWGERAENLEQAIHLFHQALEVMTRQAMPVEWAKTTTNLALAYSDRIRGGRAENLEQAIHLFHQALEVMTRQAMPVEWAKTTANLALAYSDRIQGNRAKNIEEAIKHYQQALTVITRQAMPNEWANLMNNLAAAYADRIRGERAENIEQAITYYQQVLEVRTQPNTPVDWAETMNNLAIIYKDRIRGERAENVELAITHFQQALTVMTRQAIPVRWAQAMNNLALAYQDRIRGDRSENIKQAIQLFEESLIVHTLDQFPAGHQLTQRNLGHLHFSERNWAAAQAAYARAIEAGQSLLAAAYTEVGRQAEVGETSRLYAWAAYCLFQLDRPGQALHQLEQGKTRLLAEALALAEADLAILPETQQRDVQAARETVRLLEAEMLLPPDTPARHPDRDLAEALGQTRVKLNHLIAAIRTEQPDFMPTGLDLAGILALIPAGGALVAPLVTSQGSAVFVLPHGATTIEAEHVIRLDDFTDDDLNALLVGSEDKLGWLWTYTRDMQRWQTTIESFTGRLWDVLMEPVHQKLTDLGLAQGAPVLLMPQGGLGLLPLHAAWREVDGEKRAFLDDYTVSYAPSAYALSVGQRRLREDEDRYGRKLLAVINPTGDLPFTPAEGEAVTRLFGPEAQTLVEAEATPEAVEHAAPGQTYFHFSGHGFYNWSDVMQSGLVLANKTRLTLSEIIAKLDLSSARLVTLSACETGMTDISQSPDEYIGLPAGFLQAGAPTVLSTLWAVADLSTALLMERFYRNHLDGKMDLAAALREAQLWLRDLPVKEVAEYADQCYRQSKGTKGEATLLRFKQHYDYLAENEPTTCPFVQPYYWAAFTLSGVAEEPDEIVTN